MILRLDSRNPYHGWAIASQKTSCEKKTNPSCIDPKETLRLKREDMVDLETALDDDQLLRTRNKTLYIKSLAVEQKLLFSGVLMDEEMRARPLPNTYTDRSCINGHLQRVAFFDTEGFHGGRVI